MSSPGILGTESSESVSAEIGLPYRMTDEDCRVVPEGDTPGFPYKLEEINGIYGRYTTWYIDLSEHLKTC